MPNYLYRCESCEYQWEEQRKMAEYKTPTTEPCPNCQTTLRNDDGTTNIYLVPVAPGFGDPYRMGISKAPAWFGERLQKIKDKFPGSTINTDRCNRVV